MERGMPKNNDREQELKEERYQASVEREFAPEVELKSTNKPKKERASERKEKQKTSSKNVEVFTSRLLEKEINDWLGQLVMEISKDKNIATALVPETEEFRKKYLSLRAKLVVVVEKIEDFFSGNSYATVEEFDQKFNSLDSFLPDGFYDRIMEKLKEYVQQRETARNIKRYYELEDILQSLNGQKQSPGSYFMDRVDNAIVLLVGVQDYEKCLGEGEAKRSGGVYCIEHLKMEKNDAPKIDSDVPIIFIHLSKKELKTFDDYYCDVYHNDINNNKWEQSDVYQEWLESSGSYDDEDYDDKEEEAKENHLWAYEDEFGGVINYLLEEESLFGMSFEYSEIESVIETIKHELSHARDQKRRINDIVNKELRNRSDVTHYIINEYYSYLNSMAGEVLAYASSDKNYLKDHSVFIEESIDRVKEVSIKSPFKKLYNYPKKYGHGFLKSIKKEIGSKNYEDWEVEKLWNRVEKRFEKDTLIFSEIADFILKNLEKNPYIVDFFRLEPGEMWPRLYKWLKKDKKTLKKTYQDAKQEMKQRK
jgi:hypothetical protein